MQEPSNIAELIENNPNQYNFNFQKYLQEGFEICNKYAGGFIFFFLLYFIITFSLEVIPTIGWIANEFILAPILPVGVYYVAKQINDQEPYNFDQFWKGFNYAQPLIMMSLIQFALFFFCLLPIIFSSSAEFSLDWITQWEEHLLGGEEEAPINFEFWYLLLIVPVIYFSVSWIYAPLFIIFYNMQSWEAMELSRKIVMKQWWLFAVFLLVLAIISFSGVILFGIGILYTLPLGSCIMYASWQDIVDFYDKRDDEDDLLKHLIEEGF